MPEEKQRGHREKPDVPKREPVPKPGDQIRKIDPSDVPGEPVPPPDPTEDSGNEISPRDRDYLGR